LIARRVKAAGFRELKTLDEFDFAFNPSIKRKVIFDLATGGSSASRGMFY
jgi:DNA replication protein DnaC